MLNFTVGPVMSNEYCEVIFLDRTEGISSSEIRIGNGALKLGLVGDDDYLVKFYREAAFVNGVHINAICRESNEDIPKELSEV